jgi:CRP/FNR family transcriptional regulator, cyclic AMP receptor protein
VAGAPTDVLRRVPLFSHLNQRELGQIARLFKERRFAAGETVVQEGSGGAAFFLIESGEAAVSLRGRHRATLGPGDYFGELALIDQGARSATVTAGTALVCYGATFWDFGPLVQGDGVIGWKLMQALVERLRAAEAAF